MDLIRTVSRDISPDSTKDCDCLTELYQEKENQTDQTYAQNVDKDSQTDVDYVAKFESQQAEIDHLKNELEKTVNIFGIQIRKFRFYFCGFFSLCRNRIMIEFTNRIMHSTNS